MYRLLYICRLYLVYGEEKKKQWSVCGRLLNNKVLEMHVDHFERRATFDVMSPQERITTIE
jgi:hypothetical protein